MRGREHLVNPHRLRGPEPVERVIAIVSQISRCLVPRTRLAQLLGRPRRRRLRGERHVPDASTIVGEEYQDEHEAVGHDRDDEEVGRHASAIVRISVRTSAGTVGRPKRRRPFQAHHSRKPRSVPGDDGLRRYDDERRSPSGPEAGEHPPEPPVRRREPHPPQPAAL